MSGSLLAFETATRTLSVALLQGETLVAEAAEPSGGSAAEGLLSLVDRVLVRSGVSIEQIEGFAVSVGPGSFTGLRVGLATLKGLALDPPRPVAPVSTLLALAAGVPPRGEPIAALLDARRGEVYAAVYPGHPEDGAPLVPEGLFSPEQLADQLPVPCLLVGEGIPVVARAVLQERFVGRVRSLGTELQVPRAYHVGRIGARMLASGRGIGADALVPRYGRRAQAEVHRDLRSSRVPARDRSL